VGADPVGSVDAGVGGEAAKKSPGGGAVQVLVTGGSRKESDKLASAKSKLGETGPSVTPSPLFAALGCGGLGESLAPSTYVEAPLTARPMNPSLKSPASVFRSRISREVMDSTIQ